MNEEIETTATCEPPMCWNCEEPLTEVWGADKYKIEWRDGAYHKDEDPSSLVCGKCHEELDDESAEIIMRAVGLL